MKAKEHKIQISAQIRQDKLDFLNRQVDKKDPRKESRSAVLEILIEKAQSDPSLLD